MIETSRSDYVEESTYKVDVQLDDFLVISYL